MMTVFFISLSLIKGAYHGGSAVMFSLIQTAIENKLDPYRYLTWLLKTANTANMGDTEVLQSLLPWNAFSAVRAE